MKKLKYLHTFESYLQFTIFDELIAESKELIAQADIANNAINESLSKFGIDEDASDDQIDEICEREFKNLMEDVDGPFGPLRSTMNEVVTIGSFNNDGEWVEETLPSEGPPAEEILAAATVAATVVTIVVGAGAMLYKFIQKRRALKKALSGVPEGPKKEQLRAQYKAMSANELEQIHQIKAAKAKMRGAKDAANGKEPNLSEDPSIKSAYLEGYKEGIEAKKDIKELKDLPKEEKQKEIKAMRAKVKSVSSYNDKVASLQDKLDDIQKPKR